MNHQDLIKEYDSYGFTPNEISETLNIPVDLVKAALIASLPSTTDYPANSIRYKKQFYEKTQATDRTRPLYEILYKYAPKDLNRMIKVWGLVLTARYIGHTRNDLMALKMHFGYRNIIPGNALKKICYFSDELRKAVDERDHRKCARCGRDCTKENIRYHKISHPGEMTVDNCVTLCLGCRYTKVLRAYDVDYRLFQGMDHKEFIDWINTYIPYYKNKVKK